MSKKDSSRASNEPLTSMNTDLTTMKLISVEGAEYNQFKNLERVEASSHMYNDVDVSPSAPTTILTPLIDERSEVLLVEKPIKDTPSTSKRNHKHKHHHHHHRHHHNHNCHHRVKNTGQQQPTIVDHEVSNNKSYKVDTNALNSVPDGSNNEMRLIDGQQAPLVVCNKDRETKTSKGNIPLQSVENQLISQRVASKDETQVGNFSSIICSEPTSSIINTCGVQQIIYEDDCCFPSSTMNCASNSCILQQSASIACLPQQQQQQLFLCTNPTSTQDFICSPSTTIQPTIINQIPVFNSLSTTSSSQPFICVPQTSVQQTATFIIQQQPQLQAQPIQIIQTPQTQPAQFIQISSATPQVIQTVQAPGIQNVQPQIVQTQPMFQTIQVPTQSIAASPQILYQRPYDPISIPVQNQQLAVAQTPLRALSQPSYAPPQRPGPHMFQHALARTVANRTGLSVLSPSASGFQLGQSSMASPISGAPLASTARALFTGGSQPSASLPIVPLTAGGLLIPFQPSEPSKGMIRGALPRTSGYPSGLRNFDNIRRQIQQRAQLLADLQRQNYSRIPSLPINSANSAVPPRPVFSSRVPRSSPAISSSIPQPPPAVIRSQTPYASRDIFGTSSSSNSSRSSASSRLSASTTLPTPAGLNYSTPSFGFSRRGSIVSEPAAPYQSIKP